MPGSTFRAERGAGPASSLTRWRLLLCLAVALCGLARAQAPAEERAWSRLARDGIHDPRNPGIRLLQEPAQALSPLPPDTVGNQVRWVRALREGVITPRTNILPETQVRLRETTVLMDRHGSMPIVRFPHFEHTLWLDCSNCHDRLFKPEVGANQITMLKILQGEQCGQCHGAVAFPLTECARCHNTPRQARPAGAARAP